MKDWEKKVRTWAWERLVFLADRISPEDAFRKMSGYSVYLREGKGWVLNHSRDGKGVPIWYRGSEDYERRYDGYEEEPEIHTNIKASSTLTNEEAERVVKEALWWELIRR